MKMIRIYTVVYKQKKNIYTSTVILNKRKTIETTQIKENEIQI